MSYIEFSFNLLDWRVGFYVNEQKGVICLCPLPMICIQVRYKPVRYYLECVVGVNKPQMFIDAATAIVDIAKEVSV